MYFLGLRPGDVHLNITVWRMLRGCGQPRRRRLHHLYWPPTLAAPTTCSRRPTTRSPRSNWKACSLSILRRRGGGRARPRPKRVSRAQGLHQPGGGVGPKSGDPRRDLRPYPPKPCALPTHPAHRIHGITEDHLRQDPASRPAGSGELFRTKRFDGGITRPVSRGCGAKMLLCNAMPSHATSAT